MVAFTTHFIVAPKSWDDLSASVMNLAQNRASGVAYISSVEEISDDKTQIDIVVSLLTGQADYALEIYWKGLIELAEDTVGMYLASALQNDVIVADDDVSPYAWLLLKPNGQILNIDLNADELDDNSRVEYQIAVAKDD